MTEAGLYDASVVKSSIALGALLLDGIGDTLRVSITGDVLQEVRVAKDILRYTGLRGFGPEVIACPTCARTRVDVAKLASRVTELIADVKKPLKIAVMGCAVNGPGEARAADVGVACGDGEGLLFMHGQPLKKVPEQDMLAALMHLVHTLDTEEA